MVVCGVSGGYAATHRQRSNKRRSKVDGAWDEVRWNGLDDEGRERDARRDRPSNLGPSR